jgi:hypothetical protein
MFDRRESKKRDAEYLLTNYNLPIYRIERRGKDITKNVTTKRRIFVVTRPEDANRATMQCGAQ